MTEGVEVEVKLAVDRPEAARALIEAPDPSVLAGFEAASDVRRVVVTDRYFDTADRALDADLARARLRESGAEVVLAFKRGGVVTDGVTEREELEGPASADPDPARWPESAARAALLGIIGDGLLEETARLRQERLVRDVRRADTTVELSLDHMSALDGDVTVATRWELEAELKTGRRQDLAALATALLAVEGLHPATESKRSFAINAVADSRRTEG